jgi:hypothetical protein
MRKGQISGEFLKSNAIADNDLVADEFLHRKGSCIETSKSAWKSPDYSHID